MTPDSRLLGLLRHPRFESDDQIRASVLKTAVENELPYLAKAFQQWQADGRPEGTILFFANDGEHWLGFFLPIRFGDQQLAMVTTAPRHDFVLVSAGDMLALTTLFAALLLVAFMLSHRVARRVVGTGLARSWPPTPLRFRQ
ncbi:MAG: hypothetical protein KDJ70_15615 [Candidatus Competibacteraceae bacterium]|nr:hypothetical protein [Candidatus Competibacteraceae bacterium]